MVAPRLQSTTEVWVFDPPELCTRAYTTRPPYLIHQLHRTVRADGGGVHVAVKGVPTTTTGKPNGAMDWRSVTDADLQRLHMMVLGLRPAT